MPIAYTTLTLALAAAQILAGFAHLTSPGRTALPGSILVAAGVVLAAFALTLESLAP